MIKKLIGVSFVLLSLFVLIIPTKSSAAIPAWGSGVVTLNFDDGYLSTFTQAVPLMSRYNIKATVYVNPNVHTANTPGFMSWQQVEALQNTYGWEVGSHASDHVDLTLLTLVQLQQQLTQSKADLASHGITAESFASPFGAYNNTVMSESAKVYSSHRTAWSLPNTWPYNNYELKAVMVRNTTTLTEIRNMIDQAKAQNQWLILVFHDLNQTAPGEFDYTVQNFKLILQYLQMSGVTASTVKEVTNNWGKGANLVPNFSLESGTDPDATFWTRNPVTDVTVGSNNQGVFPFPLRSAIININNSTAAATLTSDPFSINPLKKYRIKLFGKFNSYSGGDGSVIVREFNGVNPLGDQTLGGLNNIAVGSRYFSYNPSALATSVSVIVAGNPFSAFNFEFDGIELKEQ